MTTLRVVLGDQLSLSLSSLQDYNTNDLVLMCEVWDEATYVKHHKKKIVFLFSAMRHFADTLKKKKYQVQYTPIEDPENSGSLKSEVHRVLQQHAIKRILITYPGEYRVLADIKSWEADLGIPVDILPDDRFLCSPEQFADWAKDKKQLRMEYFYREMRKQYSILMDGGQPIGGQWNYDAENRKPPKNGLDVPDTFHCEPDKTTKEVITQVAKRFNDHFGDIEPFWYGVTRKQALQALQLFIEQRLCHFGEYQDAMLEDEPWMFHAHIGLYLNCGLLLPLECVELAQEAFHEGKAPINAVEGFIRQVIGWREFVRGIYWLKMPSYTTENFFNTHRNLPDFFWTGNTDMNCLRQCVTQTKETAYAHHIQRLMVLGNFLLLIGAEPRQVNEWFLIVYADAYEWVELPNVSGMALFADGGYLASKPYAASGSYINKMSDYCKNCTYQVTTKNGLKACPFNYLYWDFLARNSQLLRSNHRLAMIYKTYEKMSPEKKAAIAKDSSLFLETLS